MLSKQVVESVGTVLLLTTELKEFEIEPTI